MSNNPILLTRRQGLAAMAGAGALAAAATPAAAVLRIDITQGKVEPMPIALPSFLGATPREIQLGADITKVVTADLERSGLFRPLDQGIYVEKIRDFSVAPRFPDWRVINAQALVTGRVVTEADGRLRVEMRLWDVAAEQQLIGVSYFSTPETWRRVAHIVADAIYERITGEKGYFDTRVVFVAETGPKDRRVKRLAIMDQDGANLRYLTDGRFLALTPRFNPTTQEITYLSYAGNRPRVYILSLETGQQEILGDFDGMTYAPRFSPTGDKLIMSLARGGNSAIYVMDLRTRVTKRLTTGPSIDTSPCYSPDGTQICFNSDRGGNQQLYVMSADGGGVKRISFGQGRYATPVWSPRGDLIAFTKMLSGRFYIGVMRPDGSGERVLTESFLDEGPTWAPNGRVLMFFRQTPDGASGRGGTTRLWSVDLTGFNAREVITPTDASDPAWSPLIR